MCNGVIGCGLRISFTKNHTRNTAAATKHIIVTPSPQPAVPDARINAYTSEVMPSVEVIAPTRSKRPGCFSDSLMYSRAMSAMKMPIGTFTKSTQRHDSHDVNMPPASRPIAAPEPDTAANTPKARLRSAPSSKFVVISDSAVGEAIAPPTPCRARAASNHHDVVASPPRKEAKVNSAIQ